MNFIKFIKMFDDFKVKKQKNRRTKPIENRMLAYDFCGEITNLWNGTVEKEI